jgi:hypothetical protein
MEVLKNNYVCCSNSIKQREIELTEFQCWILERKDWDEQLNFIRQEDLDRFYESKDKELELDIICIQASEFYNEIEELLDIEDFDECFVHMKYINELQNSINLIVNVTGVNQRFRVDIS